MPAAFLRRVAWTFGTVGSWGAGRVSDTAIQRAAAASATFEWLLHRLSQRRHQVPAHHCLDATRRRRQSPQLRGAAAGPGTGLLLERGVAPASPEPDKVRLMKPI